MKERLAEKARRNPAGKREPRMGRVRGARNLDPTRRRDAGDRRDPERNTSPLWVIRSWLFRPESRACRKRLSARLTPGVAVYQAALFLGLTLILLVNKAT